MYKVEVKNKFFIDIISQVYIVYAGYNNKYYLVSFSNHVTFNSTDKEFTFY